MAFFGQIFPRLYMMTNSVVELSSELVDSPIIGKPRGGLGNLDDLHDVPLDEEKPVPGTPPAEIQPAVVVLPSPSKDSFDIVSIFISARCGEFETLLAKLREDPSRWDLILSVRDNDGHSVLHWAALFDAREFIQASCEKSGRDPDWVDCRSNNGQTPFMWAVIRGHIRSMKMLFHQFKTNIFAHDTLRADPGILAVQHHQHNAFLLLHKWAKDKNPFEWTDCSGCTAAHWAAYKGDVLLLRLMHYMQINLNPQDSQGMTPLHRATNEGWNECANFLVEKAGADVHLQNLKSESPLDIAIRLDNRSLVNTWNKTGSGSGRCKDESCKSSHGFGHELVNSKWALPGIFSACLGTTAMCYVSHFFSLDSFASVLFGFFLIATAVLYVDIIKSDPGTVPRRKIGDSAIEELEINIDSDEYESHKDDLTRICFTCWDNKPITKRVKHCSVCDKCVENMDHHCGWVNNCVGEKNHRRFIALVASVFFGMVDFAYLSISQVIDSSLPVSTQFWTKPLLLPAWMIHLVVIPWLGILLIHQLRIIGMNMNTNEMINMHRYSHFWEIRDDEKRFKNPFDQGGMLANCSKFWFRKTKGYSVIGGPNHDIEMAAVV
jgi:hypothetical protein